MLIGEGEDAANHFLRQRRNLVLISLFIIFYKVGNLEMKKVNLLGNETDIGNPAVIAFALGVFFVYFLWRYYTSCREVSGIAKFWMICTKWAEKKSKRYVEKKNVSRKLVYSNQVELIGRKFGTRVFRVFEDRNDPTIQAKEITVKYYYCLMKIISVVPAIFRTSSFSEYFLPYILAFIAIAEFLNAGLVSFAMSAVGIALNSTALAANNALGGSQVVHETLSVQGEAMSSATSNCVYDFLGICFQEPSSALSSVSVFGFSEFVTALALLLIVYTFSDVRYKFRLQIAPIPLFTMTFVCIAIIGLGTLLIDVWSASLWPVPDTPLNKYIMQGSLGFLFLSLAMIWIFYAFIRPPVFNKRNAKRYAHEFLRIVLDGSEKELPIIAHEIGRSAKNIVEISRRSPSRTQTDEENEEAKPSFKATACDYAYEILLMMGTRRLCRYIISSSPATAMVFFARFSENMHKSLPIGQFVRNISTEAILNKDSLLYHEDEGYNSGWLGYVRPFSKAIYGDYRLINMLSNDHSSPLDIYFETAWGLDGEQFETYTRATLITLEAYIADNKRGHTNSYALNRAFEFIAHAAKGIYKLDGTTDYYPTEDYAKLSTAVDFVKDAIKILNEKSIPDDRLVTRPEFQNKDIYDQIANLIFEIILSAAGVKSPRDTCWSIHYNAVWSNLFTFANSGKAQKVIYYRLRRLLYDEICQLSKLPNYKSARILAICLNVLGPVMHNSSIHREEFALHKALISWLKKNYLALRERQPDVADACIIGSITYEEDKKRLAKSYIKGLNLEEPKEYLELDAN